MPHDATPSPEPAMTAQPETVGVKMVAYHGQQEIKDKYLARVRAHREADNLIQGTGWEDGKGCAVGCTLEDYDHSKYPEVLGIPVELAYLEDKIFEGLSNGKAQAWPERFLSAIKPGADLSKVHLRMKIFALEQCRENAFDDGKAAIDQVVLLLSRCVEGDIPSNEEWSAAWSAAWEKFSDNLIALLEAA